MSAPVAATAPTAPPVRLGGTGRLGDGRRITWSLAEGVRGRRWRAVTTAPDGRHASAVLLEMASDGRVAKLEVATSDGLLTLHPDRGGTELHGNTVTPHGIRHHAFAWSAGHLLVVAGSPITAAAAAGALATRVGEGEGTSAPVVEVGAGLVVRAATWRIARTGARRWRLLPADGGEIVTVDLDAAGAPTGLDDGAAWPLEHDDPQ